MTLFFPVRLTFQLSLRIGKGMSVDLDSAVGAGMASRGDEIQTRPFDKSSNGRSLGSNGLENSGLGLPSPPVTPTGATITGP